MRIKWAVIAGVVFTAAVIVVVALMMTNDRKDAQFSVDDSALNITCSFGITVPLDEIENPELTQDVPKIKNKDNGAGIGSMQKGQYTLEGGVKARLYIDEKAPVFIRFSYGGEVYYLSAEWEDATRALFEQLHSAIREKTDT